MVPEVRFKGFSDDWELRKSNEIFSSISEKGHPELPVLSVTQDHGVVKRENLKIDIKYDKNTLKNYKLVSNGDFIISLRSFQGGFELSKIQGIVSPAYTVFKFKNPREHDSEFWKNWFKTFKFIQSLKTITFGIRDGKSISFSEFKSLKNIFPADIKEQEQIGNLLEKINNTVELQQEKINLYIKLKKGLLQKQFASDQEKVPKIRFFNFHENWEQRKLEKMIDLFSGLTYSPNDIKSSGTFVLRSSNIKSGNIVNADNVYVDNKVVNSSNVIRGDIIVVVRNGSRALIGKHALVQKSMPETVIGAFMTGIRSATPSFTNSLLDTQKFKKEINRNLGSTINQITNGSLKKMSFNVPNSLEEKSKIGTSFEIINKIIVMEQERLNELTSIKKYLLQKLFI